MLDKNNVDGAGKKEFFEKESYITQPAPKTRIGKRKRRIMGNNVVASFFASGKRKTASSRVSIYLVDKPLEISLSERILTNNPFLLKSPEMEDILLPLRLSGKFNFFLVKINVSGGGWHAQADATRLALARALVAFSRDLKRTFNKFMLLRQDIRKKEAKKVGYRAARKKEQFSKR